MKVYILRGISGVGKSTFANHLRKGREDSVLICSADSEMEEEEGYRFNSRGLDDAHKYCLRRFIDGLQKRWPIVVLDNTNLLYHHIQPYIVIAEAYDYEVRIINILAHPQAVVGRNVHGVDEKSLRKQYKRFMDDRKRINIPQRFMQRDINVGSVTWERWGQEWTTPTI